MSIADHLHAGYTITPLLNNSMRVCERDKRLREKKEVTCYLTETLPPIGLNPVNMLLSHSHALGCGARERGVLAQHDCDRVYVCGGDPHLLHDRPARAHRINHAKVNQLVSLFSKKCVKCKLAITCCVWRVN